MCVYAQGVREGVDVLLYRDTLLRTCNETAPPGMFFLYNSTGEARVCATAALTEQMIRQSKELMQYARWCAARSRATATLLLR